MKLLFFAVTKKQYHYFNKLHHHLSYPSAIYFFPSLRLSLHRENHLSKKEQKEILEKKFQEITIKYPQKTVRFFYKILLKIEFHWISSVLLFAIQKEKPTHMIVWNGQKFHQEIASLLAKKHHIQNIFFENGLLPNTTTMDFKGVNAKNSLSKSPSFYLNYPLLNHSLPHQLEIRKPYKKQKIIHQKLPDEYIFVPFQVAYDTQVLQHSPWIQSMFQLFELLQWLSKSIQIPFVIKEHPSDRVSNYTSLYKKTNQNIHFSSENTQYLIENATAIITINSTVAIESLLFNKRVILLGDAFFDIEGIVKRAKTKESLLHIIQTLPQWEVNHTLIHQFLLYLQEVYLIPTHWTRADLTHYKCIEKKIQESLC